MDERLIRYFSQEYGHLREMGAEFARQHPKIAARLALPADSKEDVADPHVERLLEGFAFLAGRIQLKIDSEFPRFVQHLFETVYPHYLCPTPSMTMVQFHPDLAEGSLAEGPTVPRGSILQSQLSESEQTKCRYKTAHDVRLWPLRIDEAVYHTRDLSALGLPERAVRTARAAIRVRLHATAGLSLNEISLDNLTLHIRGGATGMRIYEQLFTHVAGVAVHATARPPAWVEMIDGDCVQQVGFDDDEALLPFGPRSFQGYRLIQEYYQFPARFMFATLAGLGRAFARCADESVDVTILLKQVDVGLENALTAENFELFCTPAINLFERSLENIRLTDRFSEYHVVPDRNAPLDYEVHTVQEVTGLGTRGQGEKQPFESFYAARDVDGGRQPGYFAVRRVPRTLTENARLRERLGRRRSTRYVGSEVYLSLVDINQAPYPTDLRQLGVRALCTNRDLPMYMPTGIGDTDFTLDSGAPVKSIRCLGKPTRPRASWVLNREDPPTEGEYAWRLISHLSPNYLSITDTERGDGAAALRDILGLYCDPKQREIARQLEGVRDVRSGPIVRRVASAGPASFARGLEVTLSLDESAFEGTGIFLLGAVLERYFSQYVSMNVFTETVVESTQRGEVKRWPARIGRQHNI